MEAPSRPSFDYEQIPLGYYDEVSRSGHPIRQCWHRQKFARVAAALPPGPGLSLLDIGCFAGTFLGSLPPERFSRQLGVDILPRQIEWATAHYGAPFREFRAIADLSSLSSLGETFDCVTLVEVIEHLDSDQIRELLAGVRQVLRPGGTFVLTTPNYASAWPLIERILNRVSDVVYEEQHLSKFSFPRFERQLLAIDPGSSDWLELEWKTTSHFLSPFFGIFSVPFAMRISEFRDPGRWPFPLGNLILARFRRRSAESA